MTPILRPASVDDQPFLWRMLYEASHAADDGTPSVDDLRSVPPLARYVEGWGRPGDVGVVATGRVVATGGGVATKGGVAATGKGVVATKVKGVVAPVGAGVADTEDGRTAGRGVGAAWARRFTADNPGYGYVDDAIPELAVATTPQSRAAGVGTAMLTRLLDDLRPAVPAVSLSVRADNPARRLYARLGFVPAPASEVRNRVGGTSLTLILRFSP